MWESATSLCNRWHQTTVCRTCERPCFTRSGPALLLDQRWMAAQRICCPSHLRPSVLMQGSKHCLHELLTLMESTRSSTRNRRLTSAMLLLSLARTMSLYLWTISSDSATSSARYCLKDKAGKKTIFRSAWLRTDEYTDMWNSWAMFAHLGLFDLLSRLTWTGVLHQTSGWPAWCLCISWRWWWRTGGPGRCTRWRWRCCTPSETAAGGGRRQTPHLLSSHHASTQDPPLRKEEEEGLVSITLLTRDQSSMLDPHMRNWLRWMIRYTWSLPLRSKISKKRKKDLF